MLNIRTNILFDKQMASLLQSLAKSQNTSISQLIRSAVKKTYLDEESTNRKVAAVQKIFQIRPKLKNINYEEFINYGRER